MEKILPDSIPELPWLAILYDMGNFFDANRPSYGLSLFYFY